MSSTFQDRLVRVCDGWIAGVCGGVARRLGVSPLAVRLVWGAAVFFFGTGLLLYLVCWWLMPHENHLPIEPTAWVREPGQSAHPPLARTVVDRKLLGVCGGLARRWDLDPAAMRLGALGLAMVSFGTVVVVYLVLALVMPVPRAALSPA
jgi:phage shock protein C